MSVTTPSLQAPDTAHGLSRLRRRGILFVGLIVIPFALSAILNSYGALTEENAIRMAFASVAGQTIAILSVIATVVLTVRRRAGVNQIVLFVVIAIVVTTGALNAMSNAAELLLTRLDLVAETNLLNR